MRQFKYLTLAVLLLMPIAAQAQYGQRQGERADRIAERLSNRTERIWMTIRDQGSNRRDQGSNRTEEQRDLQTALRNFAANTRNFAADLSRSDPQTYRSAAQQLLNEAGNIGRLVERTETTYRLSNQWSRVEDELQKLGQFYGLPYSPSRNLARRDPYYGGTNDPTDNDRDPYYNNRREYGYDGNQSGSFRWRGRVDGTDYIYLRGNRVDIRHVQAQPIVGSSYDLPAPLPRADVNTQLKHLRGRGRVQMIQQPSASNNYTAGVMIQDADAGADDYEFELVW